MSHVCQCWFLCCLFMNAHKQTNDCIYTDRSMARKAALITKQPRGRQGRVEQKSEHCKETAGALSSCLKNCSHRGFNTVCLCFGEQGGCEWGATCQNTTTVCLLQHKPSLMVLPFHHPLEPACPTPSFWERHSLENWEPPSGRKDTLRGFWHLKLLPFWSTEEMYCCSPGWVLSGCMDLSWWHRKKTPWIAQKGSNFVGTSKEHAAGRGLYWISLSLHPHW